MCCAMCGIVGYVGHRPACDVVFDALRRTKYRGYDSGGVALLVAVADASPAKQGQRMPGTDIPIVSPNERRAAKPDRVLLTLPDLLPEVSARFPELDGRWSVDGQ